MLATPIISDTTNNSYINTMTFNNNTVKVKPENKCHPN